MSAHTGSQIFAGVPFDPALHLPRIQRPCSTRGSCAQVSATCIGGRTSNSADKNSSLKGGVVDLVFKYTRSQTSIEWTPLLKTGTQDWSSILTADIVEEIQPEPQSSVQTQAQKCGEHVQQAKIEPNSTVSSKTGEPGRKVMTVNFTPEKARLLRQTWRASETWHDTMYHSAIASRLASPDA